MTLAQLMGSWPCDTRYALALEKCLQPAVSEGDEEEMEEMRGCEWRDESFGDKVHKGKETKSLSTSFHAYRRISWPTAAKGAPPPEHNAWPAVSNVPCWKMATLSTLAPFFWA